MYQTQRFVNVIVSQLFGEYIYRMLALMTAMIFLTISNSSFALAPNPGANLACPASSTKGIFDNSNYTKLKESFDTNTYQPMTSTSSLSIPLKIKMTIEDINVNTSGNNTTITGTSANPAMDINRNFKDLTSRSDITLDFQNTGNSDSLYLNNVAISAFDIDKSIGSNKTGWDDLVSITGITRNNTKIKGTFQRLSGSSVIELANGLQTSSTNASFNCTAALDTNCQGSVLFSEDIRSVTFSYTNTNNVTTPTSQRFQFRVDSYCYTPQYTFSGIVFNDNGGITDANATNANITTGPYANNANYFNGIFDSATPNAEAGIPSSTVELTHCTNGSVYGSQLVDGSTPTIGQYKINVPITTISGNTNNLCLVEKNNNTGNVYTIRTNSNKKVIAFANTTYHYPDNNFGKVIAANVALVLKKAQYINNCPTTLNYTDPAINTSGNNDPRVGFSSASINDLVPGQCIAYRITATNRANIVISDFVMRDVLQKKGVNGAQVTSVLANPPLSTTDYNAAENPAIGANGEVKTRTLTINARNNRVFYFNTKYGTTANP
ncbi:hypothetical protein [Psychrobacter cryohalolentis]|uniref:DUF11 domain-containing protein n=1 Tax=Psychrobacter cryohalolentis (strain ATCC BAA-1226 / DSM 17306 / VKM B-2378 / K5) TaxID=335284 RepID=Q1QBX3_PSYCK|nr:hypothetical protein [Psychrobacter cryohalolentis]ABE74830.1 hypothetical protein Pcryo_1049 [Psychrobacter cryohalolentis K5]ASE27438.1 hypothetical protein CEP87_12900 [Psychrobacter cryohalolentis]